MTKIYLSSTYSDLKAYREAVYHTLRQMGYDAIAMEDYVATDMRPLEKCLQDVASCDVYVGLFAWRYGYVPPEGNPEHKSITELEYRKAISLGKSCLIFLLEKDAPWSPQAMDAVTGEGNRGECITGLRQELAKEKIVSFFQTSEHLANLVGSSVHRWDEERRKVLDDLNTRREQVRVPFMVEDLPADFVPRPQEFDELIGKLLDKQREEPIAITAALRGAGGYGKTTMAKALCHDERIQQAFDDGILWVTLGENPDDLVGKVEDLIYTLSRERPGFSGIDAATARLAELLADRAMLLVIDDVWNPSHLKPFLQGGKRCARLITTRNEEVLPVHTQSIQVDAMRQEEAVQLLMAGLDGQAPSSASDRLALEKLAARLGEWPLLLKLAHGRLRRQMSRGQLLPDALVYLNRALDEHGFVAFDAANPRERDQAVQATLGASLELLNVDESARYQELAVFPEDVDIPLDTVHTLWAATGGLNAFDTEERCLRLSDLSLLLRFDALKRTIRLHDVIRSYLQHEVGPGLLALHAQLLDASGCTRWALLPHDEPYLWDHLAEHLIGAQRSGELIATVKDLRYLASKTLARSASAVETDLVVAEQQAPEDMPLRLQHLPELSDLWRRSAAERLPPSVGLWHALTDLPHLALICTLHGHTDAVRGCAVSPDGAFIVSASDDDTLKIWDARAGTCLITFPVEYALQACAFHPDGKHLVALSQEGVSLDGFALPGAE